MRRRRTPRSRAGDPRTRQRLLDAATTLFAARGYAHVTVREICRAARANVAAINYHYGDKMALYEDVIRAATEVVQATTAEAIAEGAGRSPAEQLQAYIRVHAGRILHPTGPQILHQLVQREMQEPTGAMGALLERLLRPRFEYLFDVVARVLGLPPADPRVTLSALSVHGLIIMYRPSPLAERLNQQLGLAYSTAQIIGHLTAFAAGGLEAIGRSAGGAGARNPL